MARKYIWVFSNLILVLSLKILIQHR